MKAQEICKKENVGKTYKDNNGDKWEVRQAWHKKDIYDCSNEGIFIACMGLSKRASKINKDNIDRYLSIVDNDIHLDGNTICEMVSKMMDKTYAENYLK